MPNDSENWSLEFPRIYNVFSDCLFYPIISPNLIDFQSNIKSYEENQSFVTFEELKPERIFGILA